MLIHEQSRASQLANCLAVAAYFHLDRRAAISIIERQIHAIGEHWAAVCAEASLGEVDRALFWGRQFLNRFAFYGPDGDASCLTELADQYRVTGGGSTNAMVARTR